jgi:hypothetical protein
MSKLYIGSIEKFLLISKKGKVREMEPSDEKFANVDYQLDNEFVVEFAEFLGEREAGLFEFKLMYWHDAYEDNIRVKVGNRKYEIVAQVRVEDAEALECLAQMDKGYTYPVRYFYADECELGFFEV